MNFLKKLFGRKPKVSTQDRLTINELEHEDDIEQWLEDDMNSMIEQGCNSDEIPAGIGEFGLVSTNPVPTREIAGSESYLQQLQDSNKQFVTWDRIGSTEAENIHAPIDMYQIYNFEQEPLAIIYLCPYHKITSNKAPQGFNMLDW